MYHDIVINYCIKHQPADFEIVPQSINVSVSVAPVVFECVHPTASSVLIFTNASPTCDVSRETEGTVQFTDLSMCRETVTIWCRAYILR